MVVSGLTASTMEPANNKSHAMRRRGESFAKSLKHHIYLMFLFVVSLSVYTVLFLFSSSHGLMDANGHNVDIVIFPPPLHVVFLFPLLRREKKIAVFLSNFLIFFFLLECTTEKPEFEN